MLGTIALIGLPATAGIVAQATTDYGSKEVATTSASDR